MHINLSRINKIPPRYGCYPKLAMHYMRIFVSHSPSTAPNKQPAASTATNDGERKIKRVFKTIVRAQAVESHWVRTLYVMHAYRFSSSVSRVREACACVYGLWVALLLLLVLLFYSVCVVIALRPNGTYTVSAILCRVCLVQAIFTAESRTTDILAVHFPIALSWSVYLRVRSRARCSPFPRAQADSLRLLSLSDVRIFTSPERCPVHLDRNEPQIIRCVCVCAVAHAICALHSHDAHSFVLNFTFRKSGLFFRRFLTLHVPQHLLATSSRAAHLIASADWTAYKVFIWP